MRKLKLSLILGALIANLPISSFAERLYGPEIVEQRKIEARLKAHREKEEALNKEYKFFKKIELENYRIQTQLQLQNLKTQPIYGIEILTTGSDASEVSSMFGHSAIRLILNNDALEDVVIGPEAFVDDKELDLGKGISGGYTVIPNVMTFMDYMIRYHRSEFRSIVRTIIPTTPQMRLKLIDALLELNNNPAVFGEDGYKFLTNNCATLTIKLLEKAGIIPASNVSTENINDLSLLSFVPVLAPYTALFALAADTPMGIIHQLKDFAFTSIPNSFIPAIDIFFKEMKEHGSYFLSKKPEKWKQQDINNLSKLSTRALYMLYVGPLKLNEKLSDYVSRLLKARKLDLYEIYKMTSYNHALYQICKDSACANLNFQIIQKNWNKTELFQTAVEWGGAPDKRFNTKKRYIFSDSREYNLFMQNLYAESL